MKAFVPTQKKKLGTLQRKLMQAGVTSPNAVAIYTGVRVGLAVGLPLLFLACWRWRACPRRSCPSFLTGGWTA